LDASRGEISASDGFLITRFTVGRGRFEPDETCSQWPAGPAF